MRLGVGTVVLVLALAACGSTAPSAPVSGDASAEPAATPEAPPFASDEEIRRAMESRQQFGLRSEEAWVRFVAANPRARVLLLDFPMMPEEEVEFQAWTDAYQRVAGAVQRYAEEHPEDFSGLFIDQPNRRVVASFTANLEAHRAAIKDLIAGDDGPLDVRLAKYTNAELQAILERIIEERDWLKTIDAAFVAGGVDDSANRIDLEISSVNPAAPALIAGHFGIPPEALHVTADGTGIKLLPRGTVRGRVVRVDGSRPGDNDWDLAWTSDRPGPGSGDCGHEVGMGVARDGQFVLPCAPGGWTIRVQAPCPNGYVDIGSGHVVVPPGLPVNVVITVQP